MSRLTNNQFKENFGTIPVPVELLKLLDFQNSINNPFSQGFELENYSDKIGISTYSKDESFLSSLIEFASADGTGSTYAFWLANDKSPLNKVPIVIFGSEGGYHVVTENIQGLLKLLTYDVEPMVSWERVFYCKDEQEYQPSAEIDSYRKWVFKNYQISTLLESETFIKQAQEKYQDDFKEWVRKYLMEDE